jgi:hypothetical protein
VVALLSNPQLVLGLLSKPKLYQAFAKCESRIKIWFYSVLQTNKRKDDDKKDSKSGKGMET